MAIKTDFDVSFATRMEGLSEVEKDIVEVAKAGQKGVLEESDFSTKQAKAFLKKYSSVQSFNSPTRIHWAREQFLGRVIREKFPDLTEEKRKAIFEAVSKAVNFLPLSEYFKLGDTIKKFVDAPFASALDARTLKATVSAISILSDTIYLDESFRKQKKMSLVSKEVRPFLPKVVDAFTTGAMRVRFPEKVDPLLMESSMAYFIPLDPQKNDGAIGAIDLSRGDASPDILLHEAMHAAQYLAGKPVLAIDREVEAYVPQFVYLLSIPSGATFEADQRKKEVEAEKDIEAQDQQKKTLEPYLQALSSGNPRLQRLRAFALFMDGEREREFGAILYLPREAAHLARLMVDGARFAEIEYARQSFRHTIQLFNATRLLSAVHSPIFQSYEVFLLLDPRDLDLLEFYEKAKEVLEQKRALATNENGRKTADFEIDLLKAFQTLVLDNNEEKARQIVTQKLFPEILAWSGKRQ